MTDDCDVGSDHCRVIEPEDAQGIEEVFEYYRHLYPYDFVTRRVSPESSVLEVGCGTGYGAQFLSRSIKNVTATDVSDKAVQYVRTRYPSVTCVQAHGTSLPFESERFDVLVSFQVIEHVQDVDAYLAEAHRILRPGGRFFLTTPNRRLRLLPFEKPWNSYHVREYRDSELGGLLQSFFQKVDLQGVMTAPDLMKMEKSRVTWTKRVRPFVWFSRASNRLLTHPRLQRLRRAAGTRALQPGAPATALGVSLDDFFCSDNTKGCLDLFAVSVKTSTHGALHGLSPTP